MAKIWSAIIVLVLVICAGVWLILTPSPEAVPSTESKRVFTWHITELPESTDAPGVPRSSVTLTSGGKTYPVGEFDGSCAEIDGTGWALLEGEKTGVICWWAGGGNEIGVFEERGQFVIKTGILEEGSAEIAGFRGNFETIATIE